MRGRGRSWAHPKCPRLPFGANVLNNDHRPRRKLLPLLLRCHLQTCVAEAGHLLLLLLEHLLPRSLCSFPSTHPAGAVSAWHSHCAAWGRATTVSLWPCWGRATSAGCGPSVHKFLQATCGFWGSEFLSSPLFLFLSG